MALWIIQLAIIGIVFVVVTLMTLRESEKFNETWPPIDDDEFLRRCPPGTDRQTALKVRRIVSEQLAVEYNQIYPEQRFVDDLDCC